MLVRLLPDPIARHPLAAILLAALAVRIVVFGMTADVGTRIADEQHYHLLASNLADGRGFTGAYGPTSLRPPLYPGLVAGVWQLTDSRSLQVVRAVQAALGLATAGLAYLLGRRLYDHRAGLVAAGITALYPALLLANVLLLTETLFTFLLTAATLAMVSVLQQPRPSMALAAGILLGASALTRSVVWPFPLLLAPYIALLARGSRGQRVVAAALFLIGHTAVLTPWAVRNSRLQGMPVVVDTMGGLNLRMGNYAHTPHDRIWDAVSMEGAKSWIAGLPPAPPDGGEWTEGWKERWAREQAVAFILANPGLTLWRAAIKFGDFWGLDRDFLAGVERGLFRPPLWAAAVAGGSLLLAFPVVTGLAIFGAWLRPPADWRSHLLLLMLVAVIAALHSLIFGHPRYRLPLSPVFAVYAGAAIGGRVWRGLDGWRAWGPPAAITIGLAGIWIAQFLVRDWPHVRRLLDGALS